MFVCSVYFNSYIDDRRRIQTATDPNVFCMMDKREVKKKSCR